MDSALCTIPFNSIWCFMCYCCCMLTRLEISLVEILNMWCTPSAVFQGFQSLLFHYYPWLTKSRSKPFQFYVPIWSSNCCLFGFGTLLCFCCVLNQTCKDWNTVHANHTTVGYSRPRHFSSVRIFRWSAILVFHCPLYTLPPRYMQCTNSKLQMLMYW